MWTCSAQHNVAIGSGIWIRVCTRVPLRQCKWAIRSIHTQFRGHFDLLLCAPYWERRRQNTNLLTLVAEPGEMSLSMRLRGVCPSGVALNTWLPDPSANLILGVSTKNACPFPGRSVTWAAVATQIRTMEAKIYSRSDSRDISDWRFESTRNAISDIPGLMFQFHQNLLALNLLTKEFWPQLIDG